MCTVIGYSEMKVKKGKVVYVVYEGKGTVGNTCDKLFLYDEVADKVTPSVIGFDIDVLYGRSYKTGKAFIQDIVIL